jgi:hypothetical protein
LTQVIDFFIYTLPCSIDGCFKCISLGNNVSNDATSKLNGVKEFAVECAILKVMGANLACDATDEVMQIHGGMGYATELAPITFRMAHSTANSLTPLSFEVASLLTLLPRLMHLKQPSIEQGRV